MRKKLDRSRFFAGVAFFEETAADNYFAVGCGFWFNLTQEKRHRKPSFLHSPLDGGWLFLLLPEVDRV
ncbi:hypothetical protein IQ269_15675 [Tychonema sp. LEGE 07199]|uniref:hypothetical protein n=1 Tax=unclassified Tychonema TaxID=2642144 RepID=UPI001881EE17|nr:MULTISPECIES: hypothetical protein [unclassified Tychonema]MBE9122201.1 hypothetical protein [Tychonema sp. LEGE 07199]MBE9132986.1 hypothetical protein [Tychonema sp. LEGE 07196]